MLNTEQNKVTYLDTLHPSDAHAALSREDNEYAGRWDAVWAEAVLVDEDIEVPQEQQAAQPAQAAVPEGPIEDPRANSRHQQQQQEQQEDSTCYKKNILVVILGWSFVVAGVAVTFGMELAGSAIFLLAAGFHWVAVKAGDAGGPMILFQWLFSLLSTILWFVDTLVLMMGTFVTELLAWVAYLVCCIFGGCLAGSEWHQSVRRLCHLTRWAFRGFHEDWAFKRGLPSSSLRSQDDTPHENTSPDEEIQEVKAEDNTIVLGAGDVVIENSDKV